VPARGCRLCACRRSRGTHRRRCRSPGPGPPAACKHRAAAPARPARSRPLPHAPRNSAACPARSGPCGYKRVCRASLQVGKAHVLCSSQALLPRRAVHLDTGSAQQLSSSRQTCGEAKAGRCALDVLRCADVAIAPWRLRLLLCVPHAGQCAVIPVLAVHMLACICPNRRSPTRHTQKTSSAQASGSTLGGCAQTRPCEPRHGCILQGAVFIGSQPCRLASVTKASVDCFSKSRS